MKKKIAALLAMTGLIVSLTACGGGGSAASSSASKSAASSASTSVASSSDSKDASASTEKAKSGEKVKIGFSQCVMNHPFRIAMVDSFKKVCESYDDVELVVVEGDGDVQTEITNIESLIQQGCDAIIVSSLSGTSIYPAYKEVHDAGIPLVIAASGCADESEDAYNYYDTFVSTDEVEMGVAAADYADELLDGEGNVVMIRGVVESTNSLNRYVGWNQEAPNYPGLNVIAEQAADWIRLTANEVMANLLQANDDIDLVYSENDEMALGAYEAIKDAGREDEIQIIIMDGQQDACEAIKEGSSFKVTITNNSTMDEAVLAAYKLAHGESVEKRIVLPYEIVTEDNVDDYMARNF